ncbi:MAG: hypothetical protein ACYDD7_00835 [Acidimicrobiales bacterium]
MEVLDPWRNPDPNELCFLIKVSGIPAGSAGVRISVWGSAQAQPTPDQTFVATANGTYTICAPAPATPDKHASIMILSSDAGAPAPTLSRSAENVGRRSPKMSVG